jgi:hypothetical protein
MKMGALSLQLPQIRLHDMPDQHVPAGARPGRRVGIRATIRPRAHSAEMIKDDRLSIYCQLLILHSQIVVVDVPRREIDTLVLDDLERRIALRP